MFKIIKKKKNLTKNLFFKHLMEIDNQDQIEKTYGLDFF